MQFRALVRCCPNAALRARTQRKGEFTLRCDLPLRKMRTAPAHGKPIRRHHVKGATISQPDSPEKDVTAGLRLLCTTDLHATLWPYDYTEDAEDHGGGLARLAPMVEAARAEVRSSCLFDLGDMLQGTALADIAAEAETPATHPVIRAMNLMGYDAATLGNHDFDYGLSVLDRALGAAEFPVLSANLWRRARAGDASVTGLPYKVLDNAVIDGAGKPHRIRLGLVGVAPPQTVAWNASVLGDTVYASDAVEAVAAALPQLRAEGAELVIVLCHSGLGALHQPTMSENVACELSRLDGVDVILTGHSHGRLPGPDFTSHPGVDARAGSIWGKPALMAGSHGRFLGVLDLVLTRAGDRWAIGAHRASLRPVTPDGPPPAPAILDATRGWHGSARDALSRPVAHAPKRLTTLFAMAGHSPALRMLSDAQLHAGRDLARGTVLADLPLLSAVAPARLGGRAGPGGFTDIPEGPVRARHLLSLAPFPNRLCLAEVNGAEIRKWLERSASAFCQVPKGSTDHPLMVETAPGYNLDTIFGLTYRIDLSRPAMFDPITGQARPGTKAGRIRHLTCAGRPVHDADRFALVTNAYRASGGGHFRPAPGPGGMLCTTRTLRQCLGDYLDGQDIAAVDPPPAWSFFDQNSTVLFKSGPAAACTDAGPLAPRLTDLGVAPDGFRTFRLDLSAGHGPAVAQGIRRDALASSDHGA